MKVSRVVLFVVTLLMVMGSFSTSVFAASQPTGRIDEFDIPSQGTDVTGKGNYTSGPVVIVNGPDGNFWFTESYANKIARITQNGNITEYSIPTASSGANYIAAGPDGNLWFTEYNSDKIARITPSGVITEYDMPDTMIKNSPNGIAAGPDGNVWFTEYDSYKIARITPSGAITEFDIPSGRSPWEITAGPDGNMWFTEIWDDKVARITPDGTITEYSLPTTNSGVYSITTGPDGNLWFTEEWGNKIGRITPSGNITEFAVSTGAGPLRITTGPDGNLWFTESSANKIGRITPAGVVTEFAVPTPGFSWYGPQTSSPSGITTGPDGNVWFTEYYGNKIGVVRFGGSTPTISVAGSDKLIAETPTIPSRPTFSGTAATGATITVTVHSDPITCTATADSNGNWSCTLPSTLPAGEHTVYVTVTNLDGSTTMLGPYTVHVVGGSEVVLAPNTGVPPETNIMGNVAVGFIGGVSGLYLLWRLVRSGRLKNI